MRAASNPPLRLPFCRAELRNPTAITHIAIQEALDGKTVEWLEKVTDQQYQR